MKISSKIRRNFNFYLKCYQNLGKSGFNPWHEETQALIIAAPQGLSAVEHFKLWDSQGELFPTKEPDIAFQVMSGKKLLNFQIEQWAEGINDNLFCIGEFQEEYTWFPKWVWQSLRGQLRNPSVDPWEMQ